MVRVHILRKLWTIPDNPALARPGLGTCPWELLPSCSRLANCWRIRSVFSRAGDTSGLYQEDTEIASGHPDPASDLTAPPPTPYLHPQQPALQGRDGQVSSSPPSLVFAPATRLPPKATHQPRGCLPINSVGLWGRDPWPSFCALATPGYEPNADSPSFVQLSAKAPVSSLSC